MNAFPQYDEQQLVSLLAKGDEAAFTEVYNRYWNKLYFLAHKHLKSAEASEEIVQDVFLALWNKRAQIQIHSLPLYLAAMTRYAVYRYLANQKKFKQTSLSNLQEKPEQKDAEVELENKLLLEIIEKLSNQLPEKCRLVFIHNKLFDEPLQDVAKGMNISQKTAEAHLTKALKSIRGSLRDALSVLFIF
jgi:RNA polymerase sigma-70 factor (ECF subfamily)